MIPCLYSRRHRFAQLEMAKYQLQASNKWSFDFIKEAPITNANSQFKWEASTLSETPRFYHHIVQQPSGTVNVRNLSQLFSECENICPLSQSISAPLMIIQNPIAVNKRKIVVGVSSTSANFATSSACSNQRKITGECSEAKKKKMLPLIASLWLITPKLDLKTINSHQILILLWKGGKQRKNFTLEISRVKNWWNYFFPHWRKGTFITEWKEKMLKTKKGGIREKKLSPSFIKYFMVACGKWIRGRRRLDEPNTDGKAKKKVKNYYDHAKGFSNCLHSTSWVPFVCPMTWWFSLFFSLVSLRQDTVP